VKRGRPEKPKGTRVADQLHVGLRLPEPLASVMAALVEHANAVLEKEGVPVHMTLTKLVRGWIVERAAHEEQLRLGTTRVRDEMLPRR
jgi:hypothetical protein